jgi:stage II sporulation protein AA (anti-sigma F factor antagonist)
MDSSGLGLILGRYRRFCEQPGQFILTTPASQVRRLLELSGVDRIIPIYNTEEEAYQLREELNRNGYYKSDEARVPSPI